MANKLISQLGATASVVSTDVFEIEKLAGPPSEKATIAQLVTLLNTIYAPITGGAYVLKAGDTMTGLLTIAQATANTSAFASTGYSLTGANAQSLMSLAGTWNTSGNPVAIRLAITDTASGATSKLFELLGGAAGATSLMSLDKTGLFMVGNITSLGSVQVTNNGGFSTPARGSIIFPSDGVFQLRDTATTSFGRLQFGGTTSSFPALKRSTTILQARLADDSAYAPFEASTVRLATAFTVATLPAVGTAGRMAYVTDALTPTFLTLAVGGGAIVSPVFDNGSTWVTV